MMQERDLDLLAVQETKVSREEATDRLVAQFSLRYNVCVSHAVGTSAGCILSVKHSIGIVVETVTSCLQGRFVLCDLTYGEAKFRFICVYTPTKPHETIEHVFIDCNNAIFFWDILQRTLKIDLPLNPHGIRFLPPERDFEQMDVIFLLGLHAVWRSLLAYRHCDVKSPSVHDYFAEMVVKVRDVYKTTDCHEDVISMLDALAHIKRV